MQVGARRVSWLLKALAVPFVAAAVFHAAAVARPSITPGESTARHAFFVALNVLIAAGLWRTPRSLAFVITFAVFATQQTWSHGNDLWEAARAGHFDARSIAVLAFVPLVLALLVADRRAQK